MLHWLRFALACLAIASTAACACPLLAAPSPAAAPHACCNTQTPTPDQSHPSCCDQHAQAIATPNVQIDHALTTLLHPPLLFMFDSFLPAPLATPSPTPVPSNHGPPPDQLTLLSQRCQFLV